MLQLDAEERLILYRRTLSLTRRRHGRMTPPRAAHDLFGLVGLVVRAYRSFRSHRPAVFRNRAINVGVRSACSTCSRPRLPNTGLVFLPDCFLFMVIFTSAS